jgi:tetratricopeptide (TPR) repeat protein
MTPRKLLLCLALGGIAVILAAALPPNPQVPPNQATEAARLNNLGAAYMNQQLFEKALKNFQDAAKLDPNLGIARVNEGIAWLNMGRVDQARRLLQPAVTADPSDARAWYNLGLLSKNTGQSQAAIEAFRHVIAIDANDPDAWYFLGAAYAENKQYSEAIDAFEHALKLNPLHASAEFGLSRAYQQSGDLTHAREHLTRFAYVTQNKLGSPISLAYGEQGKYSLAEESPAAPQKVPPEIKVRFVDVTAKAGLVGRSHPLATVIKPFFYPGTGACFLDFDRDGNPDIFLADNGAQGGMSLYRNLGNGRFEDVTRKAGLDPSLHATSCTAGDYDNDGFPDLAVSFSNGMMLLHNEKNGTFRDMAEAAGIQKITGITGLTFLDYDHDGDLDLYGSRGMVATEGLATRSTSIMWRNNGNGTFTDVTAAIDVSNPFSVNAIATDYNNDRAVDLVVADRAGGTIFQNPREGKFLALHPFSSSGTGGIKADAVPSVGVVILDFDHDGWMDVVLTYLDQPAVRLWRNDHGKGFDEVKLPATNWRRAYGVAAVDYDNDGWVDLAAVGETADGRGEVRLFRNLGPDGFQDVTSEVGLDKISFEYPRAILIGDYNGDGAADLLITQNHAPPVLLENQGGNQNHWLRLDLKGLADNKSAIGTKVEVFAGGNRQKFEVAGSSGYLGQNSLELTVGLGRAREADVVRMLWPTGVLQDEAEVTADQGHKFMEIDRRGSSCPTLFVWDGQKYRFVADMLGAGVVGHWIAPGERNLPRPAEYVRIDRNTIREKDGLLSFRFMEPLEEAVYLDQVKLLAVDHPADVEVYPNEYFASNPPYPAFKVVFSHAARPPAGVRDDDGHNLLPALLAHRYVGDFTRLPFAGFTKLHSLELDLGEPYAGGPLWLLMHGEIEYFTATGMYAADQSGLAPIAPYIEALDDKGRWVRVVDDMGFPAGGPRTMTADLTDRLPQGTRKIRIWTNLEIYWDSILIDRASQNQSVRILPVSLVRAGLQFHGFPWKIEGQPPGNVNYVYERASATGPYTRPAGLYTRYGDVLPLLTEFDDKLVIFGSGDEVALEFDPSHLPALPQGWLRDYFYAAHGYEKDMDFYAYDFTSVDPLPFRDMGTYPYPGKSFPLDDLHLNYLLEYNTRYLSGHESRGYSFEYKSLTRRGLHQ